MAKAFKMTRTKLSFPLPYLPGLPSSHAQHMISHRAWSPSARLTNRVAGVRNFQKSLKKRCHRRL